MSIDAISGVGFLPPTAESIALDRASGAINLADPGSGGASPFAQILSGVESVNAGLTASSEATRLLANGQMENLHQVMIAGEQARLQFELLLQVRTKVLDAYQELMRLQI
jgi:flagellar hook-basal body complex protein FliE